jgi:hypothetical protein
MTQGASNGLGPGRKGATARVHAALPAFVGEHNAEESIGVPPKPFGDALRASGLPVVELEGLGPLVDRKAFCAWLRAQARPQGLPSVQAAGTAASPSQAAIPAPLATNKAAAYCGFKTPGAMRKTYLEGRVLPAGRRGGKGTWM